MPNGPAVLNFVADTGFAPVISDLWGLRDTTSLIRCEISLVRGQDLNLHSPAYEAGDLTICPPRNGFYF